MTLPGVVTEYLRDRLFERRLPICLTVDDDDRIVSIDGATRNILPPGVSVGDPVTDALPALAGHPLHETVELRLISMVGGTFDIHVLPSPDGAFVILLDASLEHDLLQRSQQRTNEVRLLHTAQNRMIRRMRSMIGELVEARTELDHRRQEAESSATRQSRFIAMMSHEFRTPLASIINYADLALDESADPAIVKRSNEAIARASRHLATLVEALLDDAKIEAGQIKVTTGRFAVADLIEDLTTIMAPLAAEKSLSFSANLSAQTPEFLEADATLIRQILINLLANAVKYTDEGSITLEVDCVNDALSLVVSDTGPGIPLADRDRMLEAFERGHARDREGAGLGLSICIKLATLMQGQVDIDDQYTEGCRIVVRLPVETAADAPAASPVLPKLTMPGDRASSAVILLCDDDEDMLSLAEYYLHQAGYALLLARDGLEAVEKALAYEPDLVLMDINTPRLSGLEATSRLRQSGFDNLIVALTASNLSDVDQTVFNDFLRKPIQMPVLIEKIQQLLMSR